MPISYEPKDVKLRRYGFLTGYSARNDAEEAEMETLRIELLGMGIDPGWEQVPRMTSAEADALITRFTLK